MTAIKPLRLTVFVPGRPGEIHLIADGGGGVIGRSAPADIIIDDARVSREHARVTHVDGAWRISDLHSKNGLRLDGRPVAGATLDATRWLSIGGVPVRAETGLADDTVPAAHVRRPRPADAAPLAEHVLETVRRIADCERAGIWIRGQEHPLLVVGERAVPPSLGTIRTAMMSRRPIYCSDTAGAAGIAARDSVVAGGIRALVAIPVGADAVVYADSAKPGKLFTQVDADLVESFASQLAVLVAAERLRADLDRIAHTR